MRIISQDVFGELYDKISESIVQRGDRFDGFGITDPSVITVLERMWSVGNHWGAITTLICYHYTRKDSLILRYTNESMLFKKDSDIKDIAKTLGIVIPKDISYRIELSVFKEKQKCVKAVLMEAPIKKIGKKLTERFGIPQTQITQICRLWKNKDTEKVSTIIVIYLETRLANIEVKTPNWTLGFKLQSTVNTIVDKITQKEEDRI